MENNNQQATVTIRAWIDKDGKVNMHMDIHDFTRKQVATLGVMLQDQIFNFICEGLNKNNGKQQSTGNRNNPCMD